MGKTDPQKLERYLEQGTASESGLAPEVEQLLDSLEQWPRQAEMQPRPGFLNEVARELRQQPRNQKREAAGASGRIKRLLAGAPARLATGLAGAVLVVAAAALFALWFGSLRTLQEAETTPVSATRPVTIGSLENYPEAPPSLPRYRIEIAPAAASVEEMQAWAEAFGWPDARLYRDQHNPESVLALTESREHLHFLGPAQGVEHYVAYMRDRDRGSVPGETLPMAESVAVAEAFLREHGLLPDQYHMRALPSPVGAAYGGHPLRFLLVSPDLHGYALYSPFSNPAGTALFIDAVGRVDSAGFMEIRVEEADPVAVQPAEAVVEAFLAGTVEPLAKALSLPPYEPDTTVYEATPPEHGVGEAVTVLGTDSVRVLLPVEESEPLLLQLVTREGGVYSLVGDDLSAIAGAVGDETLQVSGPIVAEMADGKWQLEVESWEVVPRQSILSGCAAGPLTFAEDGVWIEAHAALGDVERSARYRIANPPPGLEDGHMVEVCAEPLPEPGGALPWTYIYTPPRALDDYDELAGTDAAAAGTGLDAGEPGASPHEVSEPALDGRQLLVEEVELAYFVDTQESMAVDGGSAIASPVWVVRGQILPDGNEFIAYLDATVTVPTPTADSGDNRTVTGRIVEGYGVRRPVGGATLQLEPDGEVVALTQKDGRFTLNNVPFEETTVYAGHMQFVIPAGAEESLDLGTIDYPLVYPPALPLGDYPPRDTPYLVEGGDFWLAHTPERELFAFVPISPEYRDTVGEEECRYQWNNAVGRFVDPCSGDEWELDGRLNLEHSTELWSNRDLDRYATMVEEGVITVHLDRTIQGTLRGE